MTKRSTWDENSAAAILCLWLVEITCLMPELFEDLSYALGLPDWLEM